VLAQPTADEATPATPPPPSATPSEQSAGAADDEAAAAAPDSAQPGPATPKLPEISDPMLEPVTPPPDILQSWQQALRMVRSRSTSLASSLKQVELASAQARAAVVRLYPKLTATGTVQQHLLLGKGMNITDDGVDTNVDIPDPSLLWNGKISLRQPLLDLGTSYDVATAKVARRAAQHRAEDVERIVLANVADTIVAVVTAERLAEVSRVSLQSSLSTLDLTRRRVRLGAGSAVDVLRAEQEVTLNRAQVVSANESLRRAREALGMALGYPKPWGVTSNLRLDQLGEDAKRVCSPVTDLSQRADIRAAKTEIEVAERNTKSTDYQLAPTIDLVSDLTYTTSSFTPHGKPVQWTVAALLTVPLFDGGARTAQKQVNSIQIELARETLTQSQREAELEVQQALRSVRVAEEQFAVAQRSRELSRETTRLAKLSFVNGKGTSFELVDATRRYQQAELDLAVKEFEVVRARIIALLAQANCDI
jgi:outer membrane protein TolC